MKKNLFLPLLSLLIFCPVTGWSQPSAFDISGTVKTVEKKEDRKMDLPRGDVKIEEDSKILEINLRRTNPTVSGEVTVRWAVLIKDMRGNLRPITKGEQNIVLDVGIPAKLESDAFSLQKADFNFRRGNDGKMEQEVEGYAILILNAAGDELGAKFQPGSLEEKAREVMVGGGGAPEKAKRARPGKKLNKVLKAED